MAMIFSDFSKVWMAVNYLKIYFVDLISAMQLYAMTFCFLIFYSSAHAAIPKADHVPNQHQYFLEVSSVGGFYPRIQ